MSKRHAPGRGAATLLAHVEDVLLAVSGDDAFETVLAVAAASLLTRGRTPLHTRIAQAARTHPELALALPARTSADALERVARLLTAALAARPTEIDALDAIFEALVPRVAKAQKGQFFTPRHVVDFVVRTLAPRPRERVVDPACGSGAFLARANLVGGVVAHGTDIDPRAVRVARLVAILAERDPAAIRVADGLREGRRGAYDVVATNPPFAGAVPSLGFEIEEVVRRPERDALFLERSVALLAPHGRLGIVLPYNKVAGVAYAGLRRWLVERARVLAVVSLPRETFLPHTGQRTVALFAKKRPKPVAPGARLPDERVFLAASERSGKASSGEPLSAPLEHDLGEVSSALVPFLAEEGFSS